MTDQSTPTPPARQILTPDISVDGGLAALDWYRDAFGAEETVRYVGDDGRLGHGEFLVAGARVMISDAYPDIGVVAASTHDGSSCALHLEVADCDVCTTGRSDSARHRTCRRPTNHAALEAPPSSIRSATAGC